MYGLVRIVSLGGLLEMAWVVVPDALVDDLQARDVVLSFVPGDLNLVVGEVQRLEKVKPENIKIGQLVTKLERLDAIRLGSEVADQVAKLLKERHEL